MSTARITAGHYDLLQRFAENARGTREAGITLDEVRSSALAAFSQTSALVLVSGGMDSVTLAYMLHAFGVKVSLISFDYGQKHGPAELRFIAEHAKALDAGDRTHRIDLKSLTYALKSSLTRSDEEVPEGHYAEESMKSTVVPNRNAMMLAIAFAVASSEGIDYVATAVHGGDHYVYPDCRPNFLHAFQRMEEQSLEGLNSPRLLGPFLYASKADIAIVGQFVGVPYERTWSCYNGQPPQHCGRCGTCCERAEAFALAEVPDPTDYADPDYWRTVKAPAGFPKQ